MLTERTFFWLRSNLEAKYSIYYASKVDGDVFYSARCLLNETGDELCKSREIKNAFISRCILYFLQQCANTACFQVSTASWTCEYSRLPEEHRIETPRRDRIETS